MINASRPATPPYFGTGDLKVGRNTDATMLYVAISRFRRADDLLILQPFDVEVLQQGEPPQAAFLLEHLQLMATQDQDEARQQAEAYGAQVRAQRASKHTNEDLFLKKARLAHKDNSL